MRLHFTCFPEQRLGVVTACWDPPACAEPTGPQRKARHTCPWLCPVPHSGGLPALLISVLSNVQE